MYTGIQFRPGPYCIVWVVKQQEWGPAFVAIGFPSGMPDSIDMRKLLLSGSQT